VHRRDHVRLRVRLETGREVDAVAGVLDTDDTVTLALDPDGVAVVAEPQPSRVTIRASASE
jgi:thiamine transport system ATP-binding protein